MANYTSKYTGQQIDDLLDSITLDGRTFIIKDIFPTLEALQSAYPTGNEYAYQVEADRNIYLWSENNNAWESLGQIEGPQGPAGEAGQDGADGKSAYQSAVDGGFGGTEEDFNEILATAQFQLNEVKASLSHDNLLDNPWFTINQRGQNSYSGSLVYTVDRWITASGSANISTNGVTVNGTPDFFQKHELGTFEIGKTYTMSAIVDNVLKYWTFEWKDMQLFSPDMGGWRFSSFHNWYGFSFVSINIPTQNEHTIKAAKLELGTISTLHLDAPPNPQVELAKCQRYFQRITNTANTHLGFVYKASANTAYGIINITTTMRATPILVNYKVYLFNNGATIPATDLTMSILYSSNNAISVQINSASSAFTAESYMIVTDGSNPMDISADL